MKTNMNVNPQISLGVLIKQVGRVCQIIQYPGGIVLFTGGRLDAKKLAKEHSANIGLPLFCEKENGKVVLC